MDRNREVPDKVKQDRREVLDAGIAAHVAAARDGDEEAANRILDEMKALKLLVPDENGVLQTGPDVAAD